MSAAFCLNDLTDALRRLQVFLCLFGARIYQCWLASHISLAILVSIALGVPFCCWVTDSEAATTVLNKRPVNPIWSG